MVEREISIPSFSLSEIERVPESVFYAGKLEELPPTFREYSSSHRHNYFAVFFFLKGEGTHTIDFTEFKIRKHSVFFLKPGQVHSWNFIGRIEGYALKVSSDFYAQSGFRSALRDFPFFRYGSTVSGIVPKNIESIKSDFERLVSSRKTEEDPRVLNAISQLIFLQLEKEYADVSNLSSQDSKVAEFQRMLDEYFLQKRNTAFYARALGLSPALLNKQCKSVLGQSAKSLVHDRIMLEIKRLLLHSDLSLSEICRDLDFSDSAYFSRYVKIRSGLTPVEIRNRVRKVQ
ncbi:helix-turn-helix domain-containing protein [Leptospira fluminis]|uniref:Helix-turn-helix domain-containing protein n=1 Tax=Leptospira fluminis TaxID=2484979 RepID=A0A4R9GSE1_9LEPT|nr:helix-turn-helix transcriptional regulator [Leptospira fluminis]TGK20056.1 helix-turn-helix domain-containing protein [Leptospira fluminis]